MTDTMDEFIKGAERLRNSKQDKGKKRAVKIMAYGEFRQITKSGVIIGFIFCEKTWFGCDDPMIGKIYQSHRKIKNIKRGLAFQYLEIESFNTEEEAIEFIKNNKYL